MLDINNDHVFLVAAAFAALACCGLGYLVAALICRVLGRNRDSYENLSWAILGVWAVSMFFFSIFNWCVVCSIPVIVCGFGIPSFFMLGLVSKFNPSGQ